MNDLATIDFFNPETLTDPFSLYDKARRDYPIFKSTLKGFEKTVFVVTTYDLVKAAFEDHERFSSQFVEVLLQGAEPHPEVDALFEGGVPPGPLLLNIDEPVHKRYRALASAVFTPRFAAKLQPTLEGVMDSLLDAVIEKGECDFVQEIAVPYPIKIICDLLGYEPGMHHKMRRWSDAFLVRLSQQQSKAEDWAAAQDILEFQNFNRSMIADRRQNPRDDLISHIVQLRVAGVDPLTDREALSLVQEFGVAGNETSRNTLIGGMGLLLRNPALLERLKDNPGLIANAVEEMLRLLAPTAGMWRIAKAATTLGGVDIPAGAILMLRMESANRDPLKFPRPDELDVDRKNRAEHLSFGHGVHYCIGHMLARRELTVAIQKLLGRLQNIKIVEEKSDLSIFPNAILRAPKALYITFDKPAPCQRAAA